MATAPTQKLNPLPLFATASGGVSGFEVGRLHALDNDNASLFLEFIVRQRTIPDYVVNAVFLALPLSDPISPGLKKSILLRRLASDLSFRSVSEKTLEILEVIEEIDRENRGLPPSQAMKSAYCAVASSCSAFSLRQSMDDFLNSFYRIWVLRISDLEKSAAASLISEDTREVRDILWEAVKDPQVRDLVINIDLEEMLNLVREYLEQEWKTEPLLPEVVLDRIVEVLGVSRERRENREELSGVDKKQDLRANCQRMVQNTRLDRENKDTESLIKNPVEACNEELSGIDVQHRRDELASTSEVGDKDTSIEGKDAVNMLNKHLELSCLQKTEENKVASVEEVVNITLGEGKNTTENNHNSDSLPKTSLLERNPTAHTFKWTDSPPQEGRLKLNSPKRDVVSPLKVIDNKVCAKRRKIRKWTLLEEETLIKAVRKCGKGSWKFILSTNPTIFEERTEVDLKDKWRNLTRSNGPF